ncbi:XisI protein [Microcoleus sp.]|uniref:XisI protein n=1 Tax=Microcoleus sp. TaxID=44472 RepID=UPI00352459CB
MDTSATYREIVKQVILQYAKLRPSHGDIRLDPVFDETRDRYALMQVGWDRGRRVRGNLIYITLQDGKVYIEYDGMECGITHNLREQGIPENDIVLAFILDSLTALTAAV